LAIRRDGLAALLYAPICSSPAARTLGQVTGLLLRHFWSLVIEEQFYVVRRWSLAVASVRRSARLQACVHLGRAHGRRIHWFDALKARCVRTTGRHPHRREFCSAVVARVMHQSVTIVRASPLFGQPQITSGRRRAGLAWGVSKRSAVVARRNAACGVAHRLACGGRCEPTFVAQTVSPGDPVRTIATACTCGTGP
jgi:hypothetical protein